MTIELHVDGRTDGGPGPLLPPESDGRTRPNVAGDLDTVLGSAPMFRRSLAGYDRFEVQSYVQWAESELATADREREHLLARQLETRAALDEARELLGHSAGGGELLQLSRRIGTLMATGSARRTWLQLGLVCDAADAGAAGIGHKDGYLDAQTAIMLAAPAVAAVGMGAAALGIGDDSDTHRQGDTAR